MKAFMNIDTFLRNNHILIKIQKRVLECYIESIVTKVGELYTINNATVTVTNVAKMWFLRRMQRISYIAGVRVMGFNTTFNNILAIS